MNEEKIYTKYKYITFLIVLSLFFIKFYLIINNYIDTERGDGSAYFWDALFGIERFYTSIYLWLSIHPPLSFITSSLVLQLYKLFHLTSIITYVKFALIFNSLLFLISSVFIYLSIKKLYNAYVALIGLLFYSTAGVLQIFTLNGSAETYSVVYFALSLYFFISYREEKKIKYVVFSAITLLLASMCRSEVLLIAPVMFIYIIFLSGFIHAMIFGFIISLFEIFKMLMKYVVLDGSIIGYENISKFWVIKRNTIEYILFDGNTTAYFLNSFNLYFTIPVLLISTILLIKKKFRIVATMFLFMFSVLILFQYIGKINSNDRYAFFPVVLFVFMIAGTFYYLLKRYKGIDKYLTFLFIGVVLLTSLNFYSSINEKISRVPKSIIDTRIWLENNAVEEDYIFFDYMNYWSLYFRLHLASKFPLVPNEYKTHHYHYNIGNTYTTVNNLYGIKFNNEIYNHYEKKYIDPILSARYLKTNSFEFELKKKVVADFYIKQFKPKLFVIPKKSFQKYIKFTFIKNKMVPYKKDIFYVNLEFVDLNFILTKKFENNDFLIFEANYSKKFEINPIQSISQDNKKSYFRIKGKAEGLFAEISLFKNNCLKNIIVSAGYSENQEHKSAKFVYYYVRKGKNILSFGEENIKSKSKKFNISKTKDLVFYFYPKDKNNLNECINEIKLYTISEIN